jgi:hypothetical protein
MFLDLYRSRRERGVCKGEVGTENVQVERAGEGWANGLGEKGGRTKKQKMQKSQAVPCSIQVSLG